MSYRRNCNTLLSSSLQRCYKSGLCFAFQPAALWKDVLSLFVSENFNSQVKTGGGARARLRSPRHGQTREMDDRVTSEPQTVDVFCSRSKQQSCSPRLTQGTNMPSTINQTQSIDGWLVNRSTNTPGFDRYGIVRTVQDDKRLDGVCNAG